MLNISFYSYGMNSLLFLTSVLNKYYCVPQPLDRGLRKLHYNGLQPKVEVYNWAKALIPGYFYTAI